MGRAVLLQHEGSIAGSHYDWLIDAGAGGGLKAFRVPQRIDLPGVAQFKAERIADHRREYLTYEGPVSGGRGAVQRVAEGDLDIEVDSLERFVCRGRLGASEGVFEGTLTGERWLFVFVAAG